MLCDLFTAPRLLPQNVLVTSFDPESLTVSWKSQSEMYHSQAITGHEIQYTKVGSSDTKSITVTSGTTAIISGLVPCTKYLVTVAAMNDNGTGPFIPPVLKVSGEDGELN